MTQRRPRDAPSVWGAARARRVKTAQPASAAESKRSHSETGSGIPHSQGREAPRVVQSLSMSADVSVKKITK
jgi:hypothetical protein